MMKEMQELLLNELHNIRKTGANEWRACCPAHDDRTPSLSIKFANNGKILLHCFAGCSITDVTRTLGIQVTDLFPEVVTRQYRYRNTAFDQTIIYIAENDHKEGLRLSENDQKSYLQAKSRIQHNGGSND